MSIDSNGYSAYLDSRTKRCFDIAVSLVLLLPASALMLLVGLAILLCDGRPVLLMQPRAGRKGHVFRMPKFCTMTTCRSTKGDKPTCLGTFLRRHRLDELPQLFCVLTGGMSLVGPRPELPELVDVYTERHRRRLNVKPGATGLWQVRGSRQKMIHQEIRYDLLYLQNAGLCFDLKLLLMTVPFMAMPKASQL